MPSLFPVLLATHIAFALSLFLPSILLPFALRVRRSGAEAARQSSSRPVRALLWLQARGVILGTGVALTGVGLLVVLGAQLLAQPWLLVALTIYAANLAIALFIQRPNLRRLMITSGSDDRTWVLRARRQRYISYAMAGLVGTIGFLMSAKPELW